MARKPSKKPKYPKSPLDWYVEPEWATEVLIEAERSVDSWSGSLDDWGTVWDPACGMGTILKAFRSSFIHRKIHATDKRDLKYAEEIIEIAIEMGWAE
ncbi:MAG: hypothetical protein ACK4SJ_11780 [Sphingorhabdus sp.]